MASPKIIDSLTIATMLAKGFRNDWQESRSLLTTLGPDKSFTDHNLCIACAALACFGCLRGSTSGRVHVSMQFGRALAKNHAISVMAAAPEIFLADGSDVVAILDLLGRMISAWDEHIQSEPSPHWYTAKVCAEFVLGEHGRYNPFLLNAWSQWISINTTSIAETLIKLETNGYQLVP